MKIVGIIPARYASTRFPAKALADIGGTSMVRRVYEQAKMSSRLAQVVIATDDERIVEHVESFGGKVVMTSPDHQSGTDRCFEALQYLKGVYDYVINIQGDEPFIQPTQINRLASVLNGETLLATLVKGIEDTGTLLNPNVPKVVISRSRQVLYFSRQPIPFVRDVEAADWLNRYAFYKHIGIYAYRTDVLARITQLPVSSLEKAEALEQLRWLENGYPIQAVITPDDSHGIDTPEDLERVWRLFNR